MLCKEGIDGWYVVDWLPADRCTGTVVAGGWRLAAGVVAAAVGCVRVVPYFCTLLGVCVTVTPTLLQVATPTN